MIAASTTTANKVGVSPVCALGLSAGILLLMPCLTFATATPATFTTCPLLLDYLNELLVGGHFQLQRLDDAPAASVTECYELQVLDN